MANFHSINGNEVEAHYAGGDLREEIDLKADSDGYYTMLTAGAADNLTARGDGVTASFLYRTTAGSASVPDEGEATVRSIKGRTLGWNQLVTSGDTERTGEVAGNYMTVRYTNTATGKVAGHKYLFAFDAYADAQYAASITMTDNTNETKVATDTVGSTYGRIAAILTADYSHSSVTFGIRISTSLGITSLHTKNAVVFDLTAMFGAGNEPSTVAEFEALYPEPYYPYDAGSLLSVQMEGIETVGFNQWDGTYSSTGHYLNANDVTSTDAEYDITDYLPVIGGQTYYVKGLNGSNIALCWYDAEKQYIGGIRNYDLLRANPANTFTVPSNATYVRSSVPKANAATFCINLSWSGYRDGEYEPYWKSERPIPAATYFPNGMRSAGTVYDELTSDAAVTRVGAVDLGTLTWSYASDAGIEAFYATGLPILATGYANETLAPMVCSKYETVKFYDHQYFEGADKVVAFAYMGGMRLYVKDSTAGTDPAAFKAAMSGVMLHYALATPTTTTFDTPINMDYRFADFGTERIMVPTGQMSAPPTMDVAYGLNAVDTLRTLPTEYISKASDASFTAALAAALNLTITRTWDETNQRYDYTITANGE